MYLQEVAHNDKNTLSENKIVFVVGSMQNQAKILAWFFVFIARGLIFKYNIFVFVCGGCAW